jgi:O-acetyl-ADP-ribose deacetylase (regulator of RNase III)
LVESHGIRTIAFPAISTGAYGFPVDRAAKIAVREIRRFLQGNATLEKVDVVCFDEPNYASYLATIQEWHDSNEGLTSQPNGLEF